LEEKSVEQDGKNDTLMAAIERLVTPADGSLPESTLISAAFDVKQTAKELLIIVDLPGVDEDEIAIKTSDRRIEIRAPRDFDHDSEDAEEYTALHRPYGTFACSVTLPNNADPEEMTAKYKRGVLKVRIPVKRANADGS
jgi:HSP20 family protein